MGHLNESLAICHHIFFFLINCSLLRKLLFSFFSRTAAKAVKNSQFGQGSRPIFSGDLVCRRHNSVVLFCPKHRTGQHDCSPSQAVGVICKTGKIRFEMWKTKSLLDMYTYINLFNLCLFFNLCSYFYFLHFVCCFTTCFIKTTIPLSKQNNINKLEILYQNINVHKCHFRHLERDYDS